ncbi:MAG: hypothetical protein HY293_04265 [Planctomycetes bacterium]|nr:hypothetical protein [Planctomycetota bacterium]
MRKTAFAVLVLFLGGCMSAELVPVGPEPLRVKEIQTLSRVGIPSDVILELLCERGVAERTSPERAAALRRAGVDESVVRELLASAPKAPAPEPVLVVRDLYVPLWPAYSRGHWHLGLRVACSYRSFREATPVEEPDIVEPLPDLIDP